MRAREKGRRKIEWEKESECVCERKGEKEKGRERERKQHWMCFYSNHKHYTRSTYIAIFFCKGVTRTILEFWII